MLTIITEISSLTEAEIYSISQLPKQLNPPVKQGKHFPSVQWALDSPWALCPSAPEAEPGSAGAPAAEQGVLALCGASKAQPLLSRAQSKPCTPGKKPQAHKQPDMAGRMPQPRVTEVLNHTTVGNHNSSLQWRSAGPARNSACSYMEIYIALPISSTLSNNLSSLSAELIVYDWHKR